MARQDARIQLGIDLFKAWSSGDPDAPATFLAPDCVLEDIVGGTHTGWADIRAFFANGLVRWPDLALIPEKFWVSEDGVALTWMMSATQRNADFGREAIGKVWRSPGMSYLVIKDGKVVHEVDYHDRVNVPLSLGVKP